MTEENKITEEEQMQITMGLIINAGNAKAFAVEAITCAKNGDFEGAVHSQDHLMNAITFLDLAKDLVDVYERVAGLKN